MWRETQMIAHLRSSARSILRAYAPRMLTPRPIA